MRQNYFALFCTALLISTMAYAADQDALPPLPQGEPALSPHVSEEEAQMQAPAQEQPLSPLQKILAEQQRQKQTKGFNSWSREEPSHEEQEGEDALLDEEAQPKQESAVDRYLSEVEKSQDNASGKSDLTTKSDDKEIAEPEEDILEKKQEDKIVITPEKQKKPVEPKVPERIKAQPSGTVNIPAPARSWGGMD